MKEYKTFFIKTLIIFFALLVLIPAVLITAGDFFAGKYVYSKAAAHIRYWIDAKQNRADILNKKGNKIVFLSGSSLMYGFNSKYAYEKTGLPVLNLGIHAAFGSYIYNIAKHVLKDGDIVVLALECPYYEEEKESNIQGPFAEYIISYDNDYYKKSDLKKKFGLAMFLFQQYIMHPNIPKEKVLVDEDYKKQVNDFGDFVGNNETTELFKSHAKPQVITENIPEKYDEYPLYNFIKYCREHDITVYAIMPVMYHSKTFTPEEEIAYKHIRDFYKKQGVYFIGDIKSGSLYDVNFFHDTSAHANTNGAKIRTDWIIDNVLSRPEIYSINKNK
ncbi:hypothetical protein IJ818_00405 [bacterium]|nr:hypothetical protein [bacterium]